MKKLLCVVLVLLMGVVPVMAGAEQEREPMEHLLWDIPFGIGVEECIALVKERTGVELTYWGSYPTHVDYGAYEDQGITFINYPVELRAIFDFPEGKLRYFEISIFDREKWNVKILESEDGTLLTEGFVDAFREIMEINYELEKLYGAPTGGWLLVDVEEGVSRTYSFPVRNDVLDEALVEKVFTGFIENKMSGLLCISYDNVTVNIYTRTRSEWWGTVEKRIWMYLDYSARGSFNEKWAYSFEGEDGEYPY